MKTRTIITAVVIIALVVSVAYNFRSCGLDKKYSKLAAEKARVEADYAAALERIVGYTEAIRQSDETIAALNETILKKNAKIISLQSELADLQASEPPTTPEIEAMPIVINLRGQIAKLTEAFSLSQSTIKDKDAVIGEWELKYGNAIKISETWKTAYENEHSLPVQSEALFKIAERRAKMNKIFSKVAVVAAAGAVAYGLLK